MDSAQQLAVEIFQVARRWRVLLDARLKVEGLTKSAWAVLFWMSRTPGGLTQRQLAEHVGVETSTLARQLDVMEAQGLVERSAVDGDRRANLVRLTDGAWPRMEEVSRITAALRDELVGDIDPRELEIAVSVLRRIHARVR